MEENKLQLLLNLYDSLNDEDKRSFVKSILLKQGDDSTDKQGQAISDFLSGRLDVTRTGRPACPHCGSLNVVKNGTHEGSQRFRCKDCGKTLGWRTNTFLSHSRKTMEQWRLFLDCFMDKLPLRRTAGICGISLDTAFRWRHKILDGLQSIHAQVKLDGVVQADETYFPKSFKGTKRPEGEKPKARGEVASKRGLSKDLVCVPCAVNLTGKSSAVVSNLGRPSTHNLQAALSAKIEPGSTLVTDSLRSYETLARDCGAVHVKIPRGKRKKGLFNIQTVNNYHSSLKRLVNGVFKGVATKYLNNYLVYNNFVNFARESFEEKVEILKSTVFLSPLESRSFSHNISRRPAIPLL